MHSYLIKQGSEGESDSNHASVTQLARLGIMLC